MDLESLWALQGHAHHPLPPGADSLKYLFSVISSSVPLSLTLDTGKEVIFLSLIWVRLGDPSVRAGIDPTVSNIPEPRADLLIFLRIWWFYLDIQCTQNHK